MLGYKNKKMITENMYCHANQQYNVYNYGRFNYNNYYSNNLYYNNHKFPTRWDLDYKYQYMNYPSYNIFNNNFNFSYVPPIPTDTCKPKKENNYSGYRDSVSQEKLHFDSPVPASKKEEYQYDYSKEKKVKRCGVIFIIKTPDNIIENFKILVVKGVSGIWSFPKGRCMTNEEEEDCAKREVYEETGLKIDSLKDKKKFKIGRNIYYRYDCVEKQFTEFTVHDTNEVEEVGWKSITELRGLVCNKDIRSLLNYQNRLYTYHTNVFN